MDAVGGPFTVRVPASTSNLGAGFDCLGLALDLWLEARLISGAGAARYTGTISSIPPDDDFIHRMLATTEVFASFRLEVHSNIPVSRGLGSSAAARLAGLALTSLSEGRTPERDHLYAAALEAEGHPDNAGAAVYGGLVLAAQTPTRLAVHPDVGVALAVPASLSETEAARAILPATIPRQAAVEQAARAAALTTGLAEGNGDLIRYGMEDQIAVAYRKSNITGFDSAVEAGIAAGAYGVTISGAGSTLLALADRSMVTAVSQAMAEALADCGNSAEAMTPEIATDGLTIVEPSEKVQ